MLYTLVDGYPVKVTKIEVNGIVTTNPTDEQVKAIGAGYEMVRTEEPVLEDTSKKVVHSWALVDDVITDVWTVEDKSNAEKIGELQSRIYELNQSFESFKQSPLEYSNGKSYIPRWVYEFYNSILLLGESAFPMNISASDGSSDMMSYTEFLDLYRFMVQESAKVTAEVNGQIAELNAEIKEIENE